MPDETKKLIEELRAWCDEPGAKGRRAEIAKLLGTPRQTITNWLKGRQQPTGEQALVVLKFLTGKRG
jgi:DNA-binding XRE family transcriptional regulator